MPTGLSRLASPSDWPGPLNPGTGCLSCLPVGLRGRREWFPRRNAIAGGGARNCTDPAPVYIDDSTSSSGGGWSYGSSYASGPYTLSNPFSGIYCEGFNAFNSVNTSGDAESSTTTTVNKGFFTAGNNSGPGCAGAVMDTTTTTTGPGGSTLAVINDYRVNDWVTYTDTTTTTGDVAGGNYTATRVRSAIGDFSTTTTSIDAATGGTITTTNTGSVSATWTETTTYTRRLDEDTQEEADAEAEAIQEEGGPYDWGATPAEQFPWADGGTGLTDITLDTMDPELQEYPAAATPLLVHTGGGRDIARYRLAVDAAIFPAQTFRADWWVVTRQLGWGPARSGTGSGHTDTVRARTYTLSEPMAGPEDARGPLAFTDASWDGLGYVLQTVPRTPAAPAPTAGLRVAGRLRRSRLRFAVRRPGVVTFRLRELTVLDADPTDYTTALATVETAGTLAEDGTNSTAAVDYAPPDQIHSVYLFVDAVEDEDGYAVAAADWIAPGKVRDGWLGILQLDHESIQAGSVFYRRREFTQATTVDATYEADPENPPSGADGECYGATGDGALPWLAFTQTQTWAQVAGPEGTGPWALVSASGSQRGASWSGEVSPFDVPAVGSAVTSGTGWAVSATSASITDTEENPRTNNGAIWVDWGRVEPVTNPRFGGVTLSFTEAGGTTSAATYTEGAPPLEVQQSPIIYLSAPTPGTSVQLVFLRVRGA